MTQRNSCFKQICECAWDLHSYQLRDCRGEYCCLHGRKGNCHRAESDLTKYKRSLKMLGLVEPIECHSNGKNVTASAEQFTSASSTISTRLISRSVSLDHLREAIRTAWIEDRIHSTHRRLLAQAAYEEWYFKKLEEFRKKHKEENAKRMKMKADQEKEIQIKEAKAKEEFQKWFIKKEFQKREKKQINEPGNRLIKQQDTSKRAFIQWKKEKDKELAKKQKEKQEEEAKKIELERQKSEKKIMAEKAFEQWKCKFYKTKATEKKKHLEEKEKQIELKRKISETRENDTSYSIWKKTKDMERQQNVKTQRELNKLAKNEQQIVLAERLYGADQAFENWLKKLDGRKRNEFSRDTIFKNLRPWIPA